MNKFTKAELISKINKYKEDKIERRSFFNKFKSYFYQIWELILTFKNLLSKLTLISFFIQILKKYKILKRLWKILNTIVMSIFGLSLIDNFCFDFIQNLFFEIKNISWNIINYFNNTQFYQSLSNLFSNEDIPSSEKTNKNESISEIKKEKEWNSENIRQNNRNSKISEWLKPKTEPESEIKEESNYNSYKNYLIISGLIIGSCLAWVYFDEIKAGSISIWEWINSFRPGSGDDNDSTTNIESNHATSNRRNDSVIDRDIEKPVDIDTNKLRKEVLESWDAKIKGKKTIMTSPSLENLNTQAEDSWGESSGSGSPDSPSSDETVKPVNYTDITAIEIAMLRVINKNWKDFIPKSTLYKIKWIEDYGHINDKLVNEKIVQYLSEIEIDNWKIIKSSNNLLTRHEILQANKIKENLNNWINEYHNKFL